ncbi:MAG: hypothetical protein D6807_02900 [Alphaproteobacteria bacterium]|nr:MAG: hypothetical protein D6807_02900 [Alphaproteobacteria bacterium]
MIAIAMLASILALMPAIGRAQAADPAAPGGAPGVFRLTRWQQVTWTVVQRVPSESAVRTAAYGAPPTPQYRIVLFRVTEIRTVVGLLPPPRHVDASASIFQPAPATDAWSRTATDRLRLDLANPVRATDAVPRPRLAAVDAAGRRIVDAAAPRFSPSWRRPGGYQPARANGSLRAGLTWLDDVIAGRD